MAGLPPGDPQLVSMIVSHLKSQGLFDQFRRDCLADVDTKPAYLNLKQRVDNFVSNHLSNHTWSPHLNKNQLRNNIRQLVLQSGMLEQGVDRIVAQVVDPKVNHIFRPQVERVVREFLSPGSCSEEPLAPPPPPPPPPPPEIRPDSRSPEEASSSTPVAAGDAMSILDTITSLNQEASVRANSSSTEKGRRSQISDEAMQLMEDNELDMSVIDEADGHNDVKPPEDAEDTKLAAEVQALQVKTEEMPEPVDEELIEEVKMEEEESGAQQQAEEEKEKASREMTGKPSEEKQEEEPQKSTTQAKQKAKERIKEEYSLEDSDLEGLSDITVSSVHTSDLSSFEDESEDDEQMSDSSEEGELPSDEKVEGDTGDEDGERKPRRKAYIHKPFLYSRYYSDSDDEVTVEERRRSAAKDKEDRLLKRQQNRERMEEKRKHKAAQAEEKDYKKQKSGEAAGPDGPRAKEARKEQKVLEKKMALSRRRKLDSRKEGDVSSRKKGEPGDVFKKAEVKSAVPRPPQPKLIRNLSDSTLSDERHRKTSGSSVSEESSDTKRLPDKSRTHSFILELEQGSHEALKQRSVGKFDRPKLHPKERKDKERSVSDDRAKLKQKQEKKFEQQADEAQQKDSMRKEGTSEEKGEKKPNARSEKKMTGSTKEGKMSEGVADEGGSVKKMRAGPTENVKTEKDKTREKDKMKEKAKGEKAAVKGDFRQLLRPDSTGSSEDRFDMEPSSDSSKKKDKQSKEGLKRSKSHSEDKPGDKLKSKAEKEGEKVKSDQDKLNKLSSESDRDSKKVKTTEKGRIPDKSKSKSKDDAKTLSLSLKTDKKVQIPDVRSTAGTSTSKSEAMKERKKEGNTKEQQKVSEEPSHEKPDSKTVKRKLEKKNKVSEKKDEMQEEKNALKEDKPEKVEKTSKPSVSSPEREEPEKKKPLLQDDSLPISTAVTTSEDTGDAVSDVTPEPLEEKTEMQLDKMPAEANALLTLMDICTAAEARLPAASLQEDVVPEPELQDADMKMKEAALTLLSMDPDSTVASSLVCPDAGHESEEKPMETQQQQLHPAMEQRSTGTASAASQAPSQQLKEGNTNIAVESENLETKMDPSQEVASGLQEEENTPNKSQNPLSKETHTEKKVAELAEKKVSDTDEIRETSTSEVSCKAEPTEADPEITTSLSAEGAVVEEHKAKMDINTCEAESKTAEEETTSAEKSDPHTVDTNIPEEVRQSEPEAKLVKQISNVSSTDSLGEEKCSDHSEKEEKMVGRGRRKRKLSIQTGDGSKELLSSEETEQEKAAEVRTPRRGRSSRTSEEGEKEGEKEGEMEKERQEETQSRRGRRSAAKTKETTATASVVENKVDSRVEEEKEEKTQEESQPEKNAESESEVNTSSPIPKDKEAAGSSDPKETSDTSGNQAVKRKRSEETEESGKTQDEMKDASKQEEIELQKVEASSPASQSETQEDMKEKPNEEEQETTTKKPARRGRPSKAAAAEDQDKKDKKAEEKDSVQNDEEQEEDDDGDNDEKGAATRATTRAASRLEAEKNKPSKPSTRASRQGGKDEAAAASRGTRGQAAAAKGGRKREASPPAVRTRGGQKPEEPPSKRGKR